jgi:hypothetical protein
VIPPPPGISSCRNVCTDGATFNDGSGVHEHGSVVTYSVLRTYLRSTYLPTYLPTYRPTPNRLCTSSTLSLSVAVLLQSQLLIRPTPSPPSRPQVHTTQPDLYSVPNTTSACLPCSSAKTVSIPSIRSAAIRPNVRVRVTFPSPAPSRPSSTPRPISAPFLSS